MITEKFSKAYLIVLARLRGTSIKKHPHPLGWGFLHKKAATVALYCDS